MDAKALSKSKRAHTQHHKNKSYPHQKSKAPSVSSDNAGTGGKPPGKPVGEKARQAQRISKLPSNWDRYEDEFDLDLGDQSGDSTSQASDVVVPKSKGADYSYLIAEAKSQAQSQSSSFSDSFPCLDDVMPGGFFEGASSMLSVRGEGLLSWTGDDNFIVEDKTTAVQEASFLSLNLNALAEQLAKVDISQRLFVEADLLPLELGSEGSTASQRSSKTESIHGNEATDAEGSMVSVKQVFGQIQTTKEVEESANIFEDAIFSNQMPDLVNRVKDDLSSSHFSKAGQRKELEPVGQVKENSTAVSKKELPKFEASAAEAELDMLLNSFSETIFLDSPGSKSVSSSGSQQSCPTALPQLAKKGPDLSKPASVNSFDGVLDDLLEETSSLVNQSKSAQSQNVKVVSHDTSSSVTKSEVLDDFDSWLDTI